MGAPINLTATTVSSSRIDLAWQLNNPPSNYNTRIERKVAGGTYSQIDIVSAGVTSYEATGLISGYRYFFRVRHWNIDTLTYTAYSNEAEQVTILSPPYNHSAAKGPSQAYRTITQYWTNTAVYGGYNSIQVQRRKDGSEYGEGIFAAISGSAESFEDDSCDTGTKYYYHVRATRGAPHYTYSNWTAEHSATTDGVPAPSGLTASPGSEHISLEWTNGASDYDALQYYHEPLSGLGSAGTVSLNFPYMEAADFSTFQGTWHKFKVRGAYFYNDKYYWSAYSNEASSYITLPAPTNLQSNQGAGGNVNLTWEQGGLGAFRDDSDYTSIYRSVNDGEYAYLGAVITFDTLTYKDTAVEMGQKYSYKIRNRRGKPPEPVEYVDSTFTQPTSQIIGFASPSNLSASCLSPTSVRLNWTDNSENESGFKIYRGGVLIYTTGANVTTWTDTGVAASNWYTYYVKAYNAQVESAASNTVEIFTAYTPAAPSNLVAVTVSASQINLSWQDNDAYEVDFHIEESTDGVNYSDIAQVGANVAEYQRTGRSADTLYYYRVRAHNTAGYSAYSNVATARTLANVGQPTNLVVTAFSGTVTELTWTDNSSEEDGHSIERKPSGGSYAEIATTAKNVTYYRDSASLSAGTTYYYRVRAYQGAQYSDYSSEVSITTLTVPSAPTGLTVASHTDTTQRLAWGAVAGAVGYKIEKSTDGSSYAEIIKVEAGVLYYTASGLTPNTRYWYKIRAYNAAGNSDYTSAVDGYTDATYTLTDFQALVRQPIFTPILLAEINPKMTLTGWSLVSGKTYTYRHETTERGIDFERLWENGTELTEKASVADVESTAGSFFFDYHARALYVHTLAGIDPINVFIEGSFWLYLTNYQDAAVTFNDHNYLPFLKAEKIPDVSHEIRPVYEGDFTVSAGSISIMNRQSPAEGYFWDEKYAKYTWENRPVVLLMGAPGWTYDKYSPIFAGMIDKNTCRDEGMTLGLIDAREGIHRTLPINHLWPTDNPFMDASLSGTSIPILFGSKTNCFMYCLDSARKKYKFHDGRVKAVTAVKQNGTALTSGTDYFVDYKNGIITFSSSLTIAASDVLTVDFDGVPNDADELISNGADIFLYLARNYWGLSVDEINLDSVYATKAAQSVSLGVYLSREQSTSEIVRMLERSLRAYTFQDEQGRIGLKMSTATAPSDIRYLRDHEISGFSMSRDRQSLFRTVNLYYNENPKTQDWSVKQKMSVQVGWKYRNNQALDIYTYLASASEADALASAIQGDLNKEVVMFEAPASLYGLLPGDLIYLSRERYFNRDGLADAKLMRIRKIEMLISSWRTRIVAEEA